MYDIIELQHKLSEAQGKLPTSKVRIRTAAVDKANALLKSGQFTPEEVSYFAQIPMSEVHSERARIEEYEQGRRQYLATMKIDLPGEGGYVAICKR